MTTHEENTGLLRAAIEKGRIPVKVSFDAGQVTVHFTDGEPLVFSGYTIGKRHRDTTLKLAAICKEVSSAYRWYAIQQTGRTLRDIAGDLMSLPADYRGDILDEYSHVLGERAAKESHARLDD